ncbi:MAG: Spy/CpxP family protein refolding chaperone [Stellaceae bacterium]
MKTLRAPLFAAALFTGVAALGLSPAFAQATPAPAGSAATQTEAHHHQMSRMLPGQLVDGRIAFLRTELKITPAQEAQWRQVAAAMRQNANALDQQITTTRQQHANMDAVQRLALRGQFAKLRADSDARLVTALKPLYESLSPQQQQMANALIGPQHGWHRGSHHDWHHRA